MIELLAIMAIYHSRQIGLSSGNSSCFPKQNLYQGSSETQLYCLRCSTGSRRKTCGQGDVLVEFCVCKNKCARNTSEGARRWQHKSRSCHKLSVHVTPTDRNKGVLSIELTRKRDQEDRERLFFTL